MIMVINNNNNKLCNGKLSAVISKTSKWGIILKGFIDGALHSVFFPEVVQSLNIHSVSGAGYVAGFT